MKTKNLSDLAKRVEELRAKMVGDENEGVCIHRAPLMLTVHKDGTIYTPGPAVKPCWCGRPQTFSALSLMGFEIPNASADGPPAPDWAQVADGKGADVWDFLASRGWIAGESVKVYGGVDFALI